MELAGGQLEESGTDNKIDEYEAYLQANINREEQLIKFVEEFLQYDESEEKIQFGEVLQFSKLLQTGENLQTEANLVQSEQIPQSEGREETPNSTEREYIYLSAASFGRRGIQKVFPSALIRETRKLWRKKRRFENCLKNNAVKSIVENQQKGISTIRDKISEAKQRYRCHKEERECLNEEKREEVLINLRLFHNVNTKYLTTKSKPVEKMLVNYNIKHNRRCNRQKRNIAIIRKLISEYRRQKQIDELKCKRYDTKVVRKERVIKDMEVIGYKKELVPRIEPKEVKEEIEKQKETVDIPVQTEPQPKGGKKKGKAKEKDAKGKKGGKKDKQKKGGKKDGSKAKKKKSDKKGGSKGKKGITKSVVDELVLPYVPITNQRLKIKTSEDHKLADLIPEFEKLPKLTKERSQYTTKVNEMLKGPSCPNDSMFDFSTQKIEFHGFKDGGVYKKRLTISNSGTVLKKFYFHRVILEEFEPVLHVEPIDIQKLLPGFTFNITVTFTPTTSTKQVKGEVIFLTYESNKDDCKQIRIPVECISWCSKITIEPTEITFDTLPVWKARKISNNNFKILKICNTGRKPCKLIISKVDDPFKLKTTLSSPNKTSKTDIIPKISKKLQEKQEDKLPSSADEGPMHEYEIIVNLEETEFLMKQILEQCIETGFDSFTFDSYCFHVDAKSKKHIKVYFRNIDYVGNYYERYLISVFEELSDKVFDCIGKQEITIQAELTGKFIDVEPKSLDYCICVFNSVYQLHFTIQNTASIAHGLGVKFPSSLKSYLSSSENDFFVQANGHKTISIRFMPRKEIATTDRSKYYDSETGILEFPIYLYLTAKSQSNTPSTKVMIFAILTDSNGLAIEPKQKTYISYFADSCINDLLQIDCSNADYVLNIGKCTVTETIFTELELINDSSVFQVYGFIDLPKCIKILPNYGFGEILPLESKKITLEFSPETLDIPNYSLECDNANDTFVFYITVNTIKNLGGIKKPKKPFNYKYIKKLLQTTERELNTNISNELIEDINLCMALLQDVDVFNFFLEKSESETSQLEIFESNHYYDRSLATISEDENSSKNCFEEESQTWNIKSNKLWIMAKIIDPLCDISYSHIEFPDTPCGSYSIMSIDLQALSHVGDIKCLCGYANKYSKCKKHLKFTAQFEIVSDNPEISVEPACGNLQSGKKTKLTLVAQPQLSHEIIMQTAREIKIEQLLLLKRQQWEIKRRKEFEAKLLKGKSNKDKNSKVGKGKSARKNQKITDTNEKLPKPGSEPIPLSVLTFEEREIKVDYLDLYPAEMLAWKNLQPYSIEARFCCTIDYREADFERNSEKLYFTAACKVVKPDFTHNLNTQHIDFGPVVVGMIQRRIITIQNIRNKSIKPTVTSLSPTGSFTCKILSDLELPVEHLLQLPITFAPQQPGKVTEYFEVRAGRTICPLIVSGEGIEKRFTITPDFVVCRLQANPGGFADCSLEINNQGIAPITLKFVKVCELEGEIKPIESKQSQPKDQKNKKNKNKAAKPRKISKFSPTLTPEEEASLQQYFTTKIGESYYEILGGTGDTVNVDKMSKKAVKIRFGVPLPPELKSNKGKKGGKAKPKLKNNKGKKGAKVKPSKGSKATSLKGPKKYYVAKYNMMLGESSFLKDAIIISTFK